MNVNMFTRNGNWTTDPATKIDGAGTGNHSNNAAKNADVIPI